MAEIPFSFANYLQTKHLEAPLPYLYRQPFSYIGYMELKNLYNLQVNDRFYFSDDKRRVIWTLDYVEDKERKMPWGKYEPYKKYHLKDDKGNKRSETGNFKVVFLRHAS